MRVLLWIDTFFEYARETQGGPVTNIFTLISQGKVEAYLLKGDFEELADTDTDEIFIEWINKSKVNIINVSHQNLRKHDVEIIVAVGLQKPKLNRFKKYGIKILSPENFLRSYDQNTGRLKSYLSIPKPSISGSWIYASVGLLVALVIALSANFSTLDRNRSPLNSPNVGDCRYNVTYTIAEEIYTACQEVSQNHPNYISALRNEARALILLWYGEGEHGKPLEDRDDALLDNAINRLDMSLSQNQLEDPINLFFKGLALSIRHFVVRDSDQEFGFALEAYRSAYEEYLKLDDSDIRVEDYIPMIEIGHFQAKNCKYESARKIYDKVLAVAPDHPGALGSKGIALFLEENDKRSGSYEPDYSSAKQLLNDTKELLIQDIRSNEGLSGIYHNLGSIAVHESQYEDAVDYFDNSIGLMASDHFPYLAWRGKGFAQLMDDQVSDAFKTFDDAISRVGENSDYYLLWLGRGITHQQLGQIESANSDFEKAKELYLSKDGVSELDSLLSQYANLDQPAPSIEDIRSSFRNLFGAVSIHVDYQGIEDDVVEVEHDRLYPGAQGVYCE